MPVSYLFNRRLLRQRRNRLNPLLISQKRLHSYLATQINHRLDLIKRNFSHILVLGDLPFSTSDSVWQFSLTGTPHKVVFDDEYLPFALQQFDLIINFMEMHYYNDIPGFLQQVKGCLKPEGLFLSVLLGQDTLWQLRHAAQWSEEEVYGGISSGRVAPMIKLSDAAALMQRAGFYLPVVDIDTIHVHYPDTLTLLKDLQQMGLSNIMIDKEFKGAEKRFLSSLTHFYDHHYSTPTGIQADFTAIYLSGWKAASNPRQPLLPGSATARLADFL